MFYPYKIEHYEKGFACVVPDLKLFSSAPTIAEAEALMRDNLMSNIDQEFRSQGKKVPMPSAPVKGEHVGIFCVDIKDEARILLWNILQDKRLTVAEFGRLFGISRQQAHNMISGWGSTSIEKYCSAFDLLGYKVQLKLIPTKK